MPERSLPKRFEKWLGQVPDKIQKSPVWKSIAYRKALFLYDLVWEDCEVLMKDMRGQTIAISSFITGRLFP
jgi:hypothetical protein